MTFRVGMIIDGDAAGALRAMEAAERGAQRLSTATSGLTGASDRLARSQRSTTSTLALAAPGFDRAGVAAAAARTRIEGLPPALTGSRQAALGLVESLRSLGGQLATQAGAFAQASGALAGKTAALIGVRGAAVAAGTALGALAAGAVQGVRIFADYERQLLTVEQVIRATGGAAGRSVRDIDRLALGIARGTLASARDVRAAAAQLLTFRSIAGDTFDRTLWVAQDLAALGFGSIEQAALQLGKALEDPEQGLASLRRVGVSFSAAQIEMIRNFQETGRVAEAQRLILAQVEAQVGGSGPAAADGLAGAFDSVTGASKRWFELIGGRISDMIRLKDALQEIADGIEAVNERLDPGPETRAQTRQQLARELVELRAELSRLESDPRTLADPLLTAPQVADLEARIAERRQLFEQMLAAEKAAATEQNAIAQRSADAQTKLAEGRRDAVIAALEAEIEAARRTAIENEIHAHQRQAGTTAADELHEAIADLVRQKHAEAEATAESARAQDEARREVERGRAALETLIAGLQLELDVLRAGDPVMAAAIRNRHALAAATNEEANAVRGLIAELEAEQRTRAFDNEIDRIRFDTATQGMSELQRRQAEARRRLGVQDGSDEASQLNEAIRLNYEAEVARRRREGGQRSGAKASKAERDAAAELVIQLETELEILRETDPVQRELIRYREALADATEAQRQTVEALVTEIEREAQAAAMMEERWVLFRGTAFGALDDLILRGRRFEDVMANIAAAIARAALEAAVLGTGPLAGLFGGRSSSGGGLLGLLGGLVGIQRRAGGGIIHGPGGPREDRVSMMARPGDYIVNAAATQRNRAVLDAIRAGNGANVPVLASPGEYHVEAAQAGPNIAILEAINAGIDLRPLHPQRLAQGGMVRGGSVLRARDGSRPSAGMSAVADRSPHLIEISVSGTGNAEIAAGVEAAIRRAFDEYDRTVFAGRVRMVLEDDWVM